MFGHWDGSLVRGVGQFHTKHILKRLVGKGATPDATRPRARNCIGGNTGGNQFIVVNAAKQEQQVRLCVKPRSDTVHHGRNVFAHVGPVRAVARIPDLAGQGEKTAFAVGNGAHDLVGQLPLEQFYEGTNLARASLFQFRPLRFALRLDIDADTVQVRTGNNGLNLSLADAEMADRPVAHVGSSARQTVAVVSE